MYVQHYEISSLGKQILELGFEYIFTLWTECVCYVCFCTYGKCSSEPVYKEKMEKEEKGAEICS